MDAGDWVFAGIWLCIGWRIGQSILEIAQALVVEPIQSFVRKAWEARRR
jgi:hypothetical protein